MMKKRKQGHSRTPKPGHFRRPRSYKVVCSGCGKEIVTQVLPADDKKLLCVECFGK